MTEPLPLLVALAVGLVLGSTVAVLALGRRRPPEPASLAAERAAVEALVAPVRHTLDQVSLGLARAERDRAAAQAELREQIRLTAAGTEALRVQTGRLSAALRRTDVRGRWGEVQLRRIVEAAGMLPHVHFEEQSSTRDDAGELLRADLVVHLADGRDVVVDAKVPLASYLEAVDAPDDATARVLLARHASDLVGHVDALSAKEYWRRYDSPELVVLFLPAEALLSAALDVRPDLLEHAFARDVVIATPTTLLALLRTVAHAWRQDAAARNVREVHALARELHGRLGVLGRHLARLGSALDSAVDAFNGTVGSLESRVLVSARRLADLGVVDGTAESGLARPEPVTRVARVPTAPELLEHDPAAATRGPELAPTSEGGARVTYGWSP